MHKKRIAVLIFLFPMGLALEGYEPLTKEQEIAAIEQKLCSLEEKKKGHEKKVILHQRKGSDWQFSRENYLESRREYFLAEQEMDKVRSLSLRIDQLKSERLELLAE